MDFPIDRIIENEGVQAVPTPSCILCGQEGRVLYSNQRDQLFNASGLWNIKLCNHCQLAWLDPCPTREAIDKLYVRYHTHSLSSRKPLFSELRRYVREGILGTWLGYRNRLRGNLHAMVGWVAGLLPTIREAAMLGVMGLHAKRRGRLIDVGCGNGTFLAMMRDLGWEVFGVEPDREAAQIAKEQFELTVIPSTLEEAKLPDASVDAITMNHVIEHVPDPIGLLAECRRILRPGGTVVVATPNLQSLGRRVFKADWRGWEIPRHLVVFSSKALRLCAERAGLTIKSLRTTARSAYWIWVTSRIICRDRYLPGGSPERISWRLRIEGLFFQFVEHIFGNPYGEEIVLVATRS